MTTPLRPTLPSGLLFLTRFALPGLPEYSQVHITPSPDPAPQCSLCRAPFPAPRPAESHSSAASPGPRAAAHVTCGKGGGHAPAPAVALNGHQGHRVGGALLEALQLEPLVALSERHLLPNRGDGGQISGLSPRVRGARAFPGADGGGSLRR